MWRFSVRMRCCYILLITLAFITPKFCEAAYSWNTQTLSEPKYFNVTKQAILIDSVGNRHFFYGGSHLFHSVFDGVTWQTEIVDNAPKVGSNAVAAMDTAGKFHVIYHDNFNNKIRYATNQSGVWMVQSLNLGQPYMLSTLPAAISIDANNFVHIVFPNQDGTIGYATNLSGTWVESVLDSTNQGIILSGNFYLSVSVAVDSNGKVHATYKRPNALTSGSQLIYANNVAGSWVYTVLESSSLMPSYEHSSMQLDALGKVHIAYLGNDLNLRYITNASGAWVTQIVDASTAQEKSPSLAVDGNGKIHISYMAYSQTPGNQEVVRYAQNTTGAWVIYTDTTVRGGTGGATSLALDAANLAHIAYFDEQNQAIQYLTNQVGWSTTRVDTILSNLPFQPANSPIGFHSSLVVDANGKEHVSYIKYDSLGGIGGGRLMYATNASGTWVETEVFGSSLLQANQLDLAVDNLGNAHIVFYQGSSDIRYATNSSGGWVTQIIETTGDQHSLIKPSIYVDNNGFAHVCYYKGLSAWTTGAADVRYASNAAGTWQAETIATIGSLASWGGAQDTEFVSDINVDASGNPIVAYLNANRDIVSATRTAPAVWAASIIANRDAIYPWSNLSLLVTARNKVHAAYQRLYCPPALRTCVEDGLGYGTNSSGVWANEVVNDSVYLVYNPLLEYSGMTTTSIALDSAGAPQIGYIYYVYKNNLITQRVLRHSRKVGALWRNSADLKSMQVNFNSNGALGQSQSIAMSPNGTPVISFYNAENTSLDIATATDTPGPLIDIRTLPNSNALGNVNIGSSASREITISNLGQLPLTVSNISSTLLQGTGFSLDLAGGASPCWLSSFTLSPNTSCTAMVSYTPIQSGNASMTVTVNSDDPLLPQLADTFTATGVSPSPAGPSGGATPSPAGTSAGGGCTISPKAQFDPVLLLLVLISLIWAKRQRSDQYRVGS